MTRFSLTSALLAAALCSPLVAADPLKVDSQKDVLESADWIAAELRDIYMSGDDRVPGLLPDPYYWYEAGMMMTSFIDYWRLSRDDKYNNDVTEGMLHQVGETDDFMPKNQTLSMGNDDQCFWGLAAMLAAESKFPDPPQGKPQWLALAQAVYNDQVDRIDENTCDGGLRWQIFAFNNGYDYKSTSSNACFLNLAARLARFTGEDKYAKTAEKQWDWMSSAGLIDSKSWAVYDGTHIRDGKCNDISKSQWSSNAGLLAHGAAAMYSQNKDDKWRERVEKLTDSILEDFFPKGIATEAGCEAKKICNTDMVAFKGVAIRSIAAVAILAPFTEDKIRPALEKSAQAAAKTCSGGASGHRCGFSWTDGTYVKPSTSGAGEQMNALAAISNLITASPSNSNTTDSESKDGSEAKPSETPSPTESGSADAKESQPGSAAGLELSGMLAMLFASGAALLSL